MSIVAAAFLLCGPVWSVTQEGFVKTIARKNKPGAPVEGTIIRVRGSHNAVESRKDGEFSILMASLQNGDPYSIASIYKSGYEPAEQELIGRKLPCSNVVPLEILLVNSAALRKEKEDIETKARENVENFYQTRLDSLEQLLVTARISEEEFARRKEELEGQYERFEPLLKTMSDKFARTDYDRLDSLGLLIQEAIEQGNPEEVERLVREKGDLEQREAIIREQEKQITQAQKVLDETSARLEQQRLATAKDKIELAEDYYHLYSSFLARFQNDSAGYYIRKRAALDTLDADYQIQAGQFAMNMMADYPLAKTYFDRAYRICEVHYGEWNEPMFTVCNELGVWYKRQGDLEAALPWLQRSLTIREQVKGKNSSDVADELNNLGDFYRVQKDYKQAMKLHKGALKIREKQCGKNSLEVAESKLNIGSLLYRQGKYEQAKKMHLEAQRIYISNPNTPQRKVADILRNLGVDDFRLGKYEEAQDHVSRAVDIYRKVLGNNHPTTQSAASTLDVIQQQIQLLQK